ncbi:MAG: hypothetical protein FWG94_02085 [Oscillospiraceae bacterium]|nr:hypothetical protein [Oscillospiraceae bacterium]
MRNFKKIAKAFVGAILVFVLACMPVYAALDTDPDASHTANETALENDEIDVNAEEGAAEDTAPMPISGEINPDTGLKSVALPGVLALFSAGAALVVIGDKLTKRKK